MNAVGQSGVLKNCDAWAADRSPAKLLPTCFSRREQAAVCWFPRALTAPPSDWGLTLAGCVREGDLGAGSGGSCSAGTYPNGADCLTCARGKWGTGTSCIDCVAGKYSIVVASSAAGTCIDCAAGKYATVAGSDEAQNCIDCPESTYAGAGAVLCTSCPQSKYGDNSAGTESDCRTCINCRACAVGKYVSVASLELTSAGPFYQAPGFTETVGKCRPQTSPSSTGVKLAGQADLQACLTACDTDADCHAFDTVANGIDTYGLLDYQLVDRACTSYDATDLTDVEPLTGDGTPGSRCYTKNPGDASEFCTQCPAGKYVDVEGDPTSVSTALRGNTLLQWGVTRRATALTVQQASTFLRRGVPPRNTVSAAMLGNMSMRWEVTTRRTVSTVLQASTRTKQVGRNAKIVPLTRTATAWEATRPTAASIAMLGRLRQPEAVMQECASRALVRRMEQLPEGLAQAAHMASTASKPAARPRMIALRAPTASAVTLASTSTQWA